MTMKRFAIYVTAALGAATIIYSCAKGEESDFISIRKECKIAFAVDGTRTGYELSDEGGLKVDWQDGDVIYVATSDGTWGSGYSSEAVKPKIFTYNAASGLFEGEATIPAGEYTFRAQYADASQRTYLLAKSASNKLLGSQVQNGAGIDHLKNYDCMVAETTATVKGGTTIPTFCMKHIYSFVDVTIKNETGKEVIATEVSMTATDARITGIFGISNVGDATINPNYSQNVSDKVSLTLNGANIAAGAAFDAYMVVAPFGNYTGDIVIDVATSDGTTYRITKSVVGFGMERSKIYRTTIALNASTEVGDNIGGGEGIPAISGRTGWAELPEYKEGTDYIYHFHSATDASGNIRRNYSMCFDKTKRASHWIAYPLHSCYTGSVSRQNNFCYDPDISESYQAYMGSSYVGNYDRGHQLPNADRNCSREMADQTFYSTNMTPQASQFNQQGWANLENRVRSSYMCADTLYVVTGAHFGTDWDSSIARSTIDREGKVCPTPTHYYKVLLRTKTGRTGKAVAACSASELKCVCFLYKHVSSFSSVTATDLCSVTEIEKLTGLTFFTNVPNATKDSFAASDWEF